MSERCGCCGLEECVCKDPAFEDCVREKDRDSIIYLIAERRKLRDVLKRIEEYGHKYPGYGYTRAAGVCADMAKAGLQ